MPRKEDPRLITGGGRFTDDVSLPGQVYLKIFRSPYAHGWIASLDVDAAREAPGVLQVLTAAQLQDIGGLPCRMAPEGAFVPRRPVLAEDKVCFVGQAVAAVVAVSPQAAADALELIDLQVDELAACVDPLQALGGDATPIHTQHDSNQCLHYQMGDADKVDQALNDAAHLVTLDLVNNRVVPTPLEPRACVARYEDGHYTLYNPSQGAVAQQLTLAKVIFGVDPSCMRVVSLDTGGGFGVRGEIHPESVLCLFAAQRLGQPVKYSGDRSEMFLADSHGRDNLTQVRAGFNEQGELQALRVSTVANLGAYCSAAGPFVPTVAGGRIVGTVYRIPHVHHSVRCVFTNVMPVAAYRGAGRPESCYVMERLLEVAATQLGMDSLTLRRRNFITPQEMPYTLPSGVVISGGEFVQTMDMALAKADWDGFAARAQACPAGRVRGRGVGYYVESSGGGIEEEARIRVRDDGDVEVIVGTFSHGQGHRTTYSQILSDTLEIDFDRIHILQGDTDEVRFGGGTGGSRSSQMGGMAVAMAGEAVLDQARGIAADLLQTPTSQVSYAQGVFSSESNQSEVTMAQVAAAAQQPQFGGAGLANVSRYNRGGGYTFPNGCHIAEVEVDTETGVVEVVAYTAVDDCGRVINPLLAGGQVHGGVVQGIGQAIYEQVVYDADGQLLSGSFMDYAMPRASHLCGIEVAFNEVPDVNNPLGVKGIGEGGACGAPPAIVNAVLDALAQLGVDQLDMPLTPERVWRACQTGIADKNAHR